jgi:DNA-binding PadR family transcriptional regulator
MLSRSVRGRSTPALHRLEYKGWINAEWGASENNRKAKFYSLTKTGQKQLRAELESLVLAAIGGISAL